MPTPVRNLAHGSLWWGGSAQGLLECKGACATWIGPVAGWVGRGVGVGRESQQLAGTFQREWQVVGSDVVLGAWAGGVARVNVWGS